MALLKLRVRRGTKAELAAYGALDSGELGFTEDEKRLYVGDYRNVSEEIQRQGTPQER